MSGAEKKSCHLAVLTISDTRTFETDKSGDLLTRLAQEDGHQVIEREICRDDVSAITSLLNQWIDDSRIDCVITTGGTGITGRDVTPEAFQAVLEKEIPGFGEMFRWLSYQSIGTSALQSRAMAGVCRGTYLFALPGSSGAVKDGWTKILTHQLDSTYRPCNLVELFPRLQEK